MEKLLAVLATSAVDAFHLTRAEVKERKDDFVRMCLHVLPFAQSLLRIYIDFGFALIGV